MTIVAARAFQDKGKTAIAVNTMFELVFRHGYEFDEVIANISLKIPVARGPHCIDNARMRKYVDAMVTKGLKHKIIIIDEADRVFPARFWQDKVQTDALIGLWQDYKLFNYIIYTAHEGTGVDVILRSVTQIELEPHFYDEVRDIIPFTVYNALDGLVYEDCAVDLSKNVFPYYDRWEVIKGYTREIKK